ncbi:FxSxx-COOH system tetratricopeptide repeat protein [Geodermatophilus sp. SYSU D00710]
MRLVVRLLGPLEVECGDRPVRIGAAKERLILVLLALDAGRVVAAERLIDALWGEDPPESAGVSLRVLISRLRKGLAAAGCDHAILARSPGYVLAGDEVDVDVDRFAALAARGSAQLAAGSARAAAAALRAALALWRGDRLAEASETRLVGEAARLAEARLAAVEARVEADLACGRHAELVGELEQLCRANRLRERLWAQRMLALYRCGRQADALAAGQQLRMILAEELGLDPGSELRRLETAILAQDSALGPPPAARSPRVWNAPTRNPWFTGRAGLLDQLHQRLRSGEASLVVQALHGLGGVGKTQLAIEYVHRFAADYDLAWWIDAEQPVLIPGQLARLAARLDLPQGPTAADTVERLLAELRDRDRWLLIFDNAERPADIADYLPGGSGHVLITSRYPGWGALGGRLEVDILARAETVALLRARIPALSRELADKLAAELGDLPLAAAQAAGYLEQTDLPPADYLRRFRTRRATLLSKGEVVGYAGRIDTTWALALDRLRREDPAAVALLELAALLAPEPIPLTLIGDHPELLDERLRATAADADALADTVGALVGYSLARRSAAGFQVHRLVQSVIRHQMPGDRQQATAERVVALLAAAAPGDPEDPVSWPGYAQLAAHVLATSPQGESSSAYRRFILDTARYLQARGDSSASRDVSAQLLDRWRASLGPDHPDTLAAASTVTLALCGLGQAGPARALGQDTQQRSHRMLGPDHPTTLAAAAALTLVLEMLGGAQAARDLGEDTLERCRRVFGPDHATTLRAAAPLTSALAALGEMQAARDLAEDTLERCRRVFGPDHATTLLAAAAFTTALVGLGEARAARDLGEDTLERCRRVLAPDHAITLWAGVFLTIALAGLGEAQAARDLGEDILQRCRRVLAPDQGLTLSAAAALTSALAELGEAQAARDLGEDTLQRSRRMLGPDHATTQLAATALTSALAELGEAQAARDLGEDTLRRCRRVFGSDHAITLWAAAALTSALAGLGEVQAARDLGEETLRRSHRVFGQDHRITQYMTQLTGRGSQQERSRTHST